MDEAEKEALVGMLTDEYLEAYRKGEADTVEEFANAHPECRDDLLELLPTIVEMEGLSRSASHPARRMMVDYPETLGGYRLLERIGHGGMGTVFRAEQTDLHREVAVKILSPAWNADSRHCEAFENESKVIAALHHTNIISVYGAGHEGAYRYYVMALVKGKGVDPDCLRRVFSNMSYEKAVAQVGLQAAKALAYAHSQGVLHRDVKPGNLLLDSDGVLHVGDFGLATVLNMGEDAPMVTQSHDGTLRYMAPERLSRGENSFACDQYSLGLTLYELINRKPAFRECEPGNLIHRICSQPLPPLKEAGELGAIINKSINFAPEDRYDNMGEMVEDLRRFLDGEPVKARPASMLRRYVMWMKRRPAVAIWSHVAATLVVLLFVSISYGYAGVRESLVRENSQRLLAEQNAEIADSVIKRIFASMLEESNGDILLTSTGATKADARLLQDIMPYYELIASQAETGGKDMAEACYTLASIAFQTGDEATAKTYFQRALKMFAPGTVQHLRTANRLAKIMSIKHEGRKQATTLLQQTLPIYEDSQDFDIRLEKISTYMFLLVMERPRFYRFARQHRVTGHGPRRAALSKEESPEDRKRRMGYIQTAKSLIDELLQENPQHEAVRLWQFRLTQMQHFGRRRRNVNAQDSPLALLESMLKESPQSVAYRRAYLDFILRGGPRHLRQMNEETAKRAATYAGDLLAESPEDTDLLHLYIRAHDAYSMVLQSAGKTEQAASLNQQTLGVLRLLTSRSGFTPEMRERLIMLVSMHPRADAARSQQEAEISVLLQAYDEKRMKELRQRLQQMRQHRRFMRPGPRHGRHQQAPPMFH